MAVYRNMEVDIPKSHVTIEKQKNGKPALIKYVIEAPFNREKGYPEPKRTTIGHQCVGSLTKMHPTTQYKEIFPAKWEELTKGKISPTAIRIGLFTASQAVNMKTGIKDALDNVYGVDIADSVIDYALYSILFHSDVTSVFSSRMRDELLYSKEAYSDSYYSSLFEHKMTEAQGLLFKQAWASQCKEDGDESAWVCIDGSNDDCHSTGVDIAEKGHAKSKKNTNIVSFTYAVTTEGKPITFDIYRGGLVDAKAMKTVIDHLEGFGFKLNGVILDRGYCDVNVLRYLRDKNIPYVIMVKGQPEGCKAMFRSYGETIKMNAEYLVEGTFLFGIQDQVKLFKEDDRKDYVTLFFDYKNGGDRVTTLLKNLYNVKAQAEERLRQGKDPGIGSKYKELLLLEEGSEDGQRAARVTFNTEALQAAINEKGLYSVVSSEAMPPAEIHNLYSSRNASEIQYRSIKTQLGYGAVRMQCTAGVKAKFMVGFIASIIRYELECAAKKTGRSADQMIQEADKMEAQKLNGAYTYTHTETDRLKSFLKYLGADDVQKLIDESVSFENDRIAGRVPSPRHRKPGVAKGSRRKRYDEDGKVIHQKSGVARGTKRNDTNLDGSARKKPGVRQGTKRGMYNKDGSLRRKPGPKPGSHRKIASSGL